MLFFKPNQVRVQKKFLPFFYLFLASLFPLFFYVLLIDPNGKINLAGTEIATPIFLFMLLFLSLFSLLTFIFANKRRGALASLFLTGVLIFRFFGIRNSYQLIIFLVIILLIEYLYSKRH